MASPFPPMPLLPITSRETIDKCRSLPLRPSDVFICSYPKSGTTWTQHIVLSLILADRRHRSRSPSIAVRREEEQENDNEEAMDYDHVSDYAPFFEIDAHWDRNDNSLAESVRRNHDRLERRVFNTHLRWDMLPKHRQEEKEDGGSRRGDNDTSEENAPSSSPTTTSKDARSSRRLRPACGKFIYVTRNLPDVCASFYHHLSNQKEGTYTGGFDSFARDWAAGRVPFGSPLHHLLSFAEGFGDNRYREAAADGSGGGGLGGPLLLVSYERMKWDLRGEVLRIMDFLELDNIPADVLDGEILPTFDFRSMKESAHRFQPKSVTWLNGYQFLRKGESGDGKRMMMQDACREEDGDIPLIDMFRDWVKKEGYCQRIRDMTSTGLDEEVADLFLAVVD